MKISWGCQHDYRNFYSRSDTEWISIAPWINYQFLDKMLGTNTQHYHGNKRTVTSQQAQSLLWGASLRTTIKWVHAPQAVCASMALSSFLGPDGQCPHPVSLPKQWWCFTGIYDRDVRGYLTGKHAFSRLTSLTRWCLNHNVLMWKEMHLLSVLIRFQSSFFLNISMIMIFVGGGVIMYRFTWGSSQPHSHTRHTGTPFIALYQLSSFSVQPMQHHPEQKKQAIHIVIWTSVITAMVGTLNHMMHLCLS